MNMTGDRDTSIEMKSSEEESKGSTQQRSHTRLIIAAAVTTGAVIVIMIAISLGLTLNTYNTSQGEAT